MKYLATIWIALTIACILIWWAVLLWIGWWAFLILPAVAFGIHYLSKRK